jgi:hypothetical protein
MDRWANLAKNFGMNHFNGVHVDGVQQQPAATAPKKLIFPKFRFSNITIVCRANEIRGPLRFLNE